MANIVIESVTIGSVDGTVKVALRRGGDVAVCDGILIWESELVDDELFDEWVAFAKAGEEGYAAAIVEGDRTVSYMLPISKTLV